MPPLQSVTSLHKRRKLNESHTKKKYVHQYLKIFVQFLFQTLAHTRTLTHSYSFIHSDFWSTRYLFSSHFGLVRLGKTQDSSERWWCCPSSGLWCLAENETLLRTRWKISQLWWLRERKRKKKEEEHLGQLGQLVSWSCNFDWESKSFENVFRCEYFMNFGERTDWWTYFWNLYFKI